MHRKGTDMNLHHINLIGSLLLPHRRKIWRENVRPKKPLRKRGGAATPR